jgi:hypothetical protein
MISQWLFQPSTPTVKLNKLVSRSHP